MDGLKGYTIERINGRFKKNKHLEWSDISCLFSEIERLGKEKEWLIEQYSREIGSVLTRKNNMPDEDEVKGYKSEIAEEMQQALKER